MGVTLRTTIYARKGDEDMVFSSVNEAATYVNGKANRIYKCCEGVLRYHRGWQFSYKPLPLRDVSEKWRDIDGYCGKYQVSNKGNVRTMQNGKTMCLKLKDNFGYMCVVLYNGKTRKDAKVHRLVAEAFIPNPNNYPVINHKDENPSNNCVDNLEWCTQQYNVTYGSAIQKRIKSNSKVKSVVMLNLNGEVEKEFESSADAARYIGGSGSNIWAVCNNRAKTYKGKVFVYKDEWLNKEGHFNKEYLEE